MRRDQAGIRPAEEQAAAQQAVRQGHEAEHPLGEAPVGGGHHQLVEGVGSVRLLVELQGIDDGLLHHLADVAPGEGDPRAEGEGDVHMAGLGRLHLEPPHLEGEAQRRHVHHPPLPLAAVRALAAVRPPAARHQLQPLGPPEGDVVRGPVDHPRVGVPARGVAQGVEVPVLLDRVAGVLDDDRGGAAGGGGRGRITVISASLR